MAYFQIANSDSETFRGSALVGKGPEHIVRVMLPFQIQLMTKS
jgi:hypothetical protein